jgi:hypothetical protein
MTVITSGRLPVPQDHKAASTPSVYRGHASIDHRPKSRTVSTTHHACASGSTHMKLPDSQKWPNMRCEQ